MTESLSCAQVALITDDRTNADLIAGAVSDLNDRVTEYRDLAKFVSASIEKWSCAVVAQAALARASGTDRQPDVIVLDAMVRKEDMGNPGNGTAGLALLDWLILNRPEIPVIILTTTRVEGLELRLLKRRNIATLSLGEMDFMAAFAKTLANLGAPAVRSRRRITVEVREFDASYWIVDDSCEQKNEHYEYTNLPELQDLIDNVDSFKLLSNGKLSGSWQSEIGRFGDQVFSTLIAGTIGPHILNRLRGESDDSDPSPPQVDLRFDIHVRPDETARMFGLPFELAKPPGDLENFLCTRMPMARRIRFDCASPSNLSHMRNCEPVPHGRPLKLLFVNASFKGIARVVHEVTGETYRQEGLQLLKRANEEWAVIQEFASGASHCLLEPTLVCRSKELPGGRFKWQVEKMLTEGHYDILHFAGHSLTLANMAAPF